MIDPATQLAALIRAQLAAQFKAQGKGHQPAAHEAKRDAHAARDSAGAAPRADEAAFTSAESEDAQIRQLVALRVRSLSPDDPQRQRKAFRLFLESILVQAFGRDRLDDRGFDQMVDAVLQRMEADPELRAALQEAGDLLLADAGPGQTPTAR